MTGPATVGAELELPGRRPGPRSPQPGGPGRDGRPPGGARDRPVQPRAGTDPGAAGRPAVRGHGQRADQALDRGRAAAWHGGRVVMVGILPTPEPEDLQLAALSDAPATAPSTTGCGGCARSRSRSGSTGPTRWRWPPTTSALRGQHLLPGPPAGRPTSSRPTSTPPSSPPPRAGSGRQLPHLPRPPALAGDPGGPVQAGDRRPRPAGRSSRRLSRVASAPAGYAPGRWSCWRRASGCTSRCCRWLARAPAGPPGGGRACRPWRSCACTRARCGAGTGPSTTRPTAATSASRCAPCPRDRR